MQLAGFTAATLLGVAVVLAEDPPLNPWMIPTHVSMNSQGEWRISTGAHCSDNEALHGYTRFLASH
jgi:hypothetical protein